MSRSRAVSCSTRAAPLGAGATLDGRPFEVPTGDDLGRRRADRDDHAVNRRSLLVAAVAVAVAVAFADSSIVVLALPELYARFLTTIQGVAWVDDVVQPRVGRSAPSGSSLVVHRARANVLLATGADRVPRGLDHVRARGLDRVPTASRSIQGLGGALLLAGSLPVLGALAGSTARGVVVWTLAGTFGAAVGPALGGVLTQVFDWRAIFVFQAPVAGAALLATFGAHVAAYSRRAGGRRCGEPSPATSRSPLLSGALVGTLFLGVLLVNPRVRSTALYQGGRW